jgi:hypothetical protein
MCQINTSVMKKQVVCVDVHGKFLMLTDLYVSDHHEEASGVC